MPNCCCGQRNKSLYSSNGIANSVCDKSWKATHIILVDFLYWPLSDLKVAMDGKTINLEANGAHICIISSQVPPSLSLHSNQTKENTN